MPWDDDRPPQPRDSRGPDMFFLDEEDPPAAPPASAPADTRQPDVFVFDEGYAGPEADRSEGATEPVRPVAPRIPVPRPLAAPRPAPAPAADAGDPLRRFSFDRPAADERGGGLADRGLALGMPPVDEDPEDDADERDTSHTARVSLRTSFGSSADEDDWRAPSQAPWAARGAPAPAPAPTPWEDDSARDPWTDALSGTAPATPPPRGREDSLWDEDVSEEALPVPPEGRVPWTHAPAPAAPSADDDPFGPGGALDAAFGRAFGDELPTADPVPTQPATDPWDTDWRSPQLDDEDDEDAGAHEADTGGLPLMGQSSLQQELEERPLLDPQPVFLKQLDSPITSLPPPPFEDAPAPDAGASRVPGSRVPAAPEGARRGTVRPELVPVDNGEHGAAGFAKGLLVAIFMGVVGYAGYQAWLHLVKGQPQLVQLVAPTEGATEASSPDDPAPSAGAPSAPDAGPAADEGPATDAAPALVSAAPRDPAPVPEAPAPGAGGGDEESVEAARARRAKDFSQGVLQVLTDRPADVWVDGRKVGRTPMRPLPLTPGWHDVRLVAAKGRRTRHDARTRIDGGQARQLSVEFAVLEKGRRR